MMTPKEAIEELEYAISGECTENFGDFVDEIEMAIEALEKQIPKKPTHEATLPKCFTCPSCKNVVDEFTTFNGQKVRVENPYCKLCGQALDWSEEG